MTAFTKHQQRDDDQHRVLGPRGRLHAGGGAQVGQDVPRHRLGQGDERAIGAERLLHDARVERVGMHGAVARERNDDEGQRRGAAGAKARQRQRGGRRTR